MGQIKDKLLDHNYDNIQELDNPLPGWWVAIFYGTTIFAVIYFIFYHFGGPGKNPNDILAEDLSRVQAVAATSGANSGPSDSDYESALKDMNALAAGKKVFTEKCLACHGPDGGGIIGPNLTDNFWISGDGKMPSIAKVVANGIADKGMPPWGAILKQDEMVNVVAFVKSLKGTKPANPKAPQGTEVKD